MDQRKTGLGRGLDALISIDSNDALLGNSENVGSSINEIDIDSIFPNPNQPRREFDEAALADLATSIKSVGLIQPITLKDMSDGTYMIIAGERRWRAAQLAGLVTVPAYVKRVDDDTVMEMALIENIQREDLNSIEVALAYKKLIEQYGLTQEVLAQRVGKSRSAVTNAIRLLKLPAELQLALKNKTLSMGHARAMLPIENAELQLQLFHLITANDLSVRKVEQMVKDLLEGKISDFAGSSASNKNKDQKAANNELFEALTQHLSNVFSTKVKMACNDKGQGKITIPFKNEKELEHIMSLLDDMKS